MKFKNPKALEADYKKTSEDLEKMIKEHKDVIPKVCIKHFYDNYPEMSYILNGEGGLNELYPVQNKFTDEEISKIVAVLDKHNFKHDTIIDSLTNKKLEHAYHRHDYTLGNKDSGLVYVLKMSNTPILERFEKGHASNWYSLIMASAHGKKMPLPFHKRYDNIDSLCNFIDEVLA